MSNPVFGFRDEFKEVIVVTRLEGTTYDSGDEDAERGIDEDVPWQHALSAAGDITRERIDKRP